MQVNIIPPRVAFIDPRTNTIAREWYLFLLRAKEEIMDMPQALDNRIANNVFAPRVSVAAVELFMPQAENILATQVYGG